VYEVEDTYPEIAKAIYEFQTAPQVMPMREVEDHLEMAGVVAAEMERAVELLLWYGFIGVSTAAGDADQYAYGIRYNIPRLLHLIRAGGTQCVIHPAFREALGVK
jgi:hypothetical protein